MNRITSAAAPRRKDKDRSATNEENGLKRQLYVDADNKPHSEVFDKLGTTKVYELKLSH